jgi:hypothetical protein
MVGCSKSGSEGMRESNEPGLGGFRVSDRPCCAVSPAAETHAVRASLSWQGLPQVRRHAQATEDGSNQNPFGTIQAAVDVASPGDSVRVDQGVHHNPGFGRLRLGVRRTRLESRLHVGDSQRRRIDDDSESHAGGHGAPGGAGMSERHSRGALCATASGARVNVLVWVPTSWRPI